MLVLSRADLERLLEEAATARLAYDRAMAQGIGTEVSL